MVAPAVQWNRSWCTGPMEAQYLVTEHCSGHLFCKLCRFSADCFVLDPVSLLLDAPTVW
jgi:hypothetical protein